MKFKCQHLDDHGKRCRRIGAYDEVFGDSSVYGATPWLVVYTCDKHRVSPRKRAP